MSPAVPRHAITFLGRTARHAGKLGLRKGLQEAALMTNPASLLIEASISVLDAVGSYYRLKQARAERDGLRAVRENLEERLSLERQTLKVHLELLKRDLEAKGEVKERLAELTRQCAQQCMIVFGELDGIRAADLPDMAEFDQALALLEDNWQAFRHSLANYQAI